jgi:hypothetical protein
MSRPFLYACTAGHAGRQRALCSRSVAAILTDVAIQGTTLTEIPTELSAKHSGTQASAPECTVGTAQLPGIAVNPAIHAIAHANLAPDFPAVISHLAMHCVAWCGIGWLSHAADNKQAR